MSIKELYSQFIITSVLKLQEGESLSINSSQSHFEFAQIVAQMGSEVTRQPVYVVITEGGKAQDVFTYTPLNNLQLTTEPSLGVLLRFDESEYRGAQIEETPTQIIQEAPLLQKCGNLAPPQLSKEVAPWAIVAIPGPKWAYRLYKEENEHLLWREFSKIFSLESSNIAQQTEEHYALIKDRTRSLNRLNSDHYILRSGESELTLSKVEQSRWRDGIHTLSNRREFVPYLIAERISMLVDVSSVSGTIASSEPFEVLGEVVEGATFTFFNGELISFDAKKGKEVLRVAFSVDQGASQMSELSIVDKQNSLAHLKGPTGYCGFDENRVSSILFGMGEASHIEALEEYESEEELKSKTGCNTSFIRIRIPIGLTSLSLYNLDESGNRVPIISDGSFQL